MPKIKYDTKKVNEISISAAKTSSENIQKASANAASITFPEGDFGWGSIPGILDDASDNMNKYATWLTSIDESMKVTKIKSEEDLSKIKFEDIKIRKSIVK